MKIWVNDTNENVYKMCEEKGLPKKRSKLRNVLYIACPPSVRAITVDGLFIITTLFREVGEINRLL